MNILHTIANCIGEKAIVAYDKEQIKGQIFFGKPKDGIITQIVLRYSSDDKIDFGFGMPTEYKTGVLELVSQSENYNMAKNNLDKCVTLLDNKILQCETSQLVIENINEHIDEDNDDPYICIKSIFKIKIK